MLDYSESKVNTLAPVNNKLGTHFLKSLQTDGPIE